MPDENRVFDVTKPKNVSPSASSKPIIVGHQPRVSDPMVKDRNLGMMDAQHKSIEPTKIMVNGAHENQEETPVPVTTDAPAIIESSAANDQPAHFSAPPEELHSFGLPADSQPTEDAKPALDYPPVDSGENTSLPAPHEHQTAPPTAAGHIEGLHLAKPRKSSRWPKIAGLAALILIGGYLLLDSGLVTKSVNLPFHVFHQKTPAPPAPVTTTPKAAVSTVPAGFKVYKLAGTNLTFAAPLVWGDPASTLDPGYSQRGADAKSDGTYAYLVTFSSNKDVQIAVTSGKYLPTTRTTLYYDYLQWCIGSADAKIYESTLHFTTTNKVDTPSTVTCDQGPVPNATKINDTTMVQTKAVDSENKVIGDIYTKNLKDTDLPVFRVKDATLTNTDSIKKLLATVQVGATTQ
jgi:hypothetical protein